MKMQICYEGMNFNLYEVPAGIVLALTYVGANFLAENLTQDIEKKEDNYKLFSSLFEEALLNTTFSLLTEEEKSFGYSEFEIVLTDERGEDEEGNFQGRIFVGKSERFECEELLCEGAVFFPSA